MQAGSSAASAAGFVISGNRIMTNAHVVANNRYITVERDGDPNNIPRKCNSSPTIAIWR